MILTGEAKRLRVYIGEDDKHDGRPLYEQIVSLARQEGVAGATVTRGVLGFGANSRVHTAKILRLSEDLPIVIEIVDKPEVIEALLPRIDALVEEGLVTVEPVHVHIYRHNKPPQQ